MGNSGWTADPNSITWPPGAGTGTARIVAGADTPPELSGSPNLISVAILFYDVVNGVEIGYHFIAQGLTQLGLGSFEGALDMGYVVYPTPGDPSSPTPSDVTYQMSYAGDISQVINTYQAIYLRGVDIVNTWGDPFPMVDGGYISVPLSIGDSQVAVNGNLFTRTFAQAPAVNVQILSGNANMSRWTCRVSLIAPSSFNFIMEKGAAADANLGVNLNVLVSWNAVQR